MRYIGAPGSEDRKKFLAVCGFAVVAAGLLYYEFRDTTPPAAAVAPVAAPAVVRPAPGGSEHGAKSLGTTAAGLDPTLRMDAMRVTESLRYEGTGRNIFSSVSEPAVVIQRPIAPARPVVVPVAAPVNPGPPPPPPIDLKFAGYFAGPNGSDRQVILVHGDDVQLAHVGDTVWRRYKVVQASASSVQVEDLQYNNRQMLPLMN